MRYAKQVYTLISLSSLSELKKDVEKEIEKTKPPWTWVHISKSQRKGKTPEEIQEMRYQKYINEEAEE